MIKTQHVTTAPVESVTTTDNGGHSVEFYMEAGHLRMRSTVLKWDVFVNREDVDEFIAGVQSMRQHYLNGRSSK